MRPRRYDQNWEPRDANEMEGVYGGGGYYGGGGGASGGGASGGGASGGGATSLSPSRPEGAPQQFHPPSIVIEPTSSQRGPMSHAYIPGGGDQQLTSQSSNPSRDGSVQIEKGHIVYIDHNNNLITHQRYALDSETTSPQDAASTSKNGSTYVPQQQIYSNDGVDGVEPVKTTEPDFAFHSTVEALAEECGWQIGRDKFLWNNEVPVANLVATDRGFLGRGTVGIVDEVTITGFRMPIARKRFVLQRGKQSAARDRKDIQSEVETLKSLYHTHIIKILGCYEEQWGQAPSICALMFPAADEDLGHFLYEECQPASDEQKRWIDTWFGCLASALAYMHSQNVHHEDIKPSNIVHRGQKIYFTDFGSSRRLEAGQDTSTESPARASRLFAAPEAMSEDGKITRHGSKTDVFSLGLVFVEMLAVFSHKNVSEMRDFLFKDEKLYTKRYCHVIDKIPTFLGPSCIKYWEHCLGKMLHPLRPARPSARGVNDMMKSERGLGIFNTSCSCQKRRTIGPIDDQPVAPFLTSRELLLKPSFPDGSSHFLLGALAARSNKTPRGLVPRKDYQEVSSKRISRKEKAHYDTLMWKWATDSDPAESTQDHGNKSPEALDDDFVWIAG